MAALCARMTTNMAAETPSRAVTSARSKAGSPRVGSPRGIVPTVAAPWLARSRTRLAVIASMTAINGPGMRRAMTLVPSTVTMTPADTATSTP